MKKVKAILTTLPLAALIAIGIVSATALIAPGDTVSAINMTEGMNSARGEEQPAELFSEDGSGMFQQVTNVLLFLVGAVSVIMLIFGGIRYVISGGDQNAVTGAKNTILYAVIGIIVALLAYAVVNFVVGSFVSN